MIGRGHFLMGVAKRYPPHIILKMLLVVVGCCWLLLVVVVTNLQTIHLNRQMARASRSASCSCRPRSTGWQSPEDPDGSLESWRSAGEGAFECDDVIRRGQTSAETDVERSRLPHRGVADGLLRLPFERGVERAKQPSSPRADSHRAYIEKGIS